MKFYRGGRWIYVPAMIVTGSRAIHILRQRDKNSLQQSDQRQGKIKRRKIEKGKSTKKSRRFEIGVAG
jgi:hypothetical protein